MKVQRTGKSFVRVALSMAPGRAHARHSGALIVVTDYGSCTVASTALLPLPNPSPEPDCRRS